MMAPFMSIYGIVNMDPDVELMTLKTLHRWLIGNVWQLKELK